jgi:hypothetical protein
MGGKSRDGAKVGTDTAILTLESFYSYFSSVSSASSVARVFFGHPLTALT